nr:MAG TPA: hypothetical protein [Caudoviricetes sp.]
MTTEYHKLTFERTNVQQREKYAMIVLVICGQI